MTLAYSGKSRKRKGLLALGAILAILIGTAMAFGARDGTAFAGGSHHNGDHPDGDGGSKTGSITIAKVWSGGEAGTANFSGYASFSLTGDTSHTIDKLKAGSYTFTEAAMDGWSASVTCDSGDSGTNSVTVKLWSGKDVTCTFTNTATTPPPPTTGTITIAKVWSGGTPGTASFTGSAGAFQLTGDTSTTFSDLAPGPYTFAETAMEGWDTSVACTSGESGGASTTVNLAAGQDVTCTFTNTAQAVGVTGNITIVKQWVGGEGTGTANFTGSQSFSLTGNAQQAFNGLESGQTYTFTEDALDNWVTSASCTGAANYSGAGTSSVAVTLGQGEDVVCTFVNTFQQPQTTPGSIVVNKEWVDGEGNPVTTDLPAEAIFTYGASGTITVNAESGWTGTATDLQPGQYTVNEQAIDGWKVSGFSCSLTSGVPAESVAAGATFNLGEGETWTCTFTNMQVSAPSNQYTVTVGKYISGDHATAENTGGTPFALTSTWNAANLGGEGTGDFTLGPDNGYEAVTSAMDAGSSYSVVENGVPTSADACTADTPFYLAGYGVSSTSLADAAANLGSNAISDLQGNMYIAVVNLPCQPQVITGNITLNKVWTDLNGAPVSAGLPGSVSFTGSGAGIPGSFNITPDSNGVWTTTFTNLATGSFGFAEITPAGWNLVGFTCVDQNDANVPVSSGGFVLEAGANVVCTLTNQVLVTPPPPTGTTSPTTPTATPTTPTATPTTPTATPTTPTATPTTPTATSTAPSTATQETPVASPTGTSAVGGFPAPGVTPLPPSTGSGASSSSSVISLGVILGLVTMAGSSAIFFATRKRR